MRTLVTYPEPYYSLVPSSWYFQSYINNNLIQTPPQEYHLVNNLCKCRLESLQLKFVNQSCD